MINPFSELVQDRIIRNECPECGVPLVPDEEATIWSGEFKGEWDGHSFKGGCEHFPKNMRISIG